MANVHAHCLPVRELYDDNATDPGLSAAFSLFAEEVMLAEEDKNAEEKSPLDGRLFCLVLFLLQ